MPCLQLKDGNKLGKAKAILRYLGKIHGYYPEDPFLAYKCDSFIDRAEDVLSVISKPHFAADGDNKKKLISDLFDKTLKEFFVEFETTCGENFLCGEKLSIADFWVCCIYFNFINN